MYVWWNFKRYFFPNLSGKTHVDIHTCWEVVAEASTSCALAALNTLILGHPFCRTSSGTAAGWDVARAPDISNTSRFGQWAYDGTLKDSLKREMVLLHYNTLKKKSIDIAGSQIQLSSFNDTWFAITVNYKYKYKEIKLPNVKTINIVKYTLINYQQFITGVVSTNNHISFLILS